MWSAGASLTDTLTLTAVWTLGAARTLTVSAEKAGGGPATQLDLAVTVIPTVVHVSTADPAADDANPGTRLLPRKTIRAAYLLAGAATLLAEVHVAAGTYTTAKDATRIAMVEGVSIVGGYSVDWTARDPELQACTVNADPAVPGAAMFRATGTTAATRIEGLRIVDATYASTPSFFSHQAIEILGNGSLTVRRNRFTLGALTGTEAGAGVRAVLANPGSVILEDNEIVGTPSIGNASAVIVTQSSVIERNVIRTAAATESRGVTVSDAGNVSQIRNNVIVAAAGTASSYAIRFFNGGEGVVRNNTLITSPDGTNAASAIVLSENAGGVIENNILVAVGAGTSRGIRETDTTSNPTLVRNNLFFGVTYVYTDLDVAGGNKLTVADMEMLLDMTATGNLQGDPLFADADYRLSAGSPAATSGLDLSAFFTVDVARRPRSAPWSIGAHER